MSSRRGERPTDSPGFWTLKIGRGSKSASDDTVEQEVFERQLPGVNLLPARVRESIAISKSRTVLLLLIVLLAAAVYGLWWMQASAIDDAEAALARSQTLNSELVEQTAALAPAKQFYSEVTTLEQLVSTTLADQPQAREVLDRLDDAIATTGGKPPVNVLSVSVTYTGIPEAGGPLSTCPNPDPFNSEITIGCLNFSASAASRAQVSTLLRTMEADPMFTGPYVTSTTTSGGAEGEETTVTFSGSAGISATGLVTPLTEEQREAIVNPPAEEDPNATEDGGAADEEAPA